jgi:hypothetical protein
MPSQAWVTVGILAAVFALLIWDRLPARLVFMGTLTACMRLKLASPEALLKGLVIPAFAPRCSAVPSGRGDVCDSRRGESFQESSDSRICESEAIPRDMSSRSVRVSDNRERREQDLERKSRLSNNLKW